MATCKDCERWHQKFYCFCGDAFGNERNDVERVCKDFKKIEENIMNREILFRSKRVDNGEWVYGFLFCIWEKTYILWGTTNDVPNMIEVIPETIGQYTGLTDKNGKKIFEGDIIQSLETKETAVVQWFPEHSAFMVWCKSSNEVGFLYECTKSNIEVIGNIYDNPELFEVNKNDKL